jgi:hypothetical protein
MSFHLFIWYLCIYLYFHISLCLSVSLSLRVIQQSIHPSIRQYTIPSGLFMVLEVIVTYRSTTLAFAWKD